jgi:D-glycero-beta-D-manno-heptose 1-phosphate adenylyltransferase
MRMVYPDEKLCTAEQVAAAVGGGPCLLSNGCFDLLHAGHVAALSQPLRLGCPTGPLVVLLNSDASIRALKPGRPIYDQDTRALMLASLAVVDYVVIFDGPDCAAEIRTIAPARYIKGEEYRDTQNPAEAQALADCGAEIIWQPRVGTWSTSSLIAVCAKAYLAEEDL